MTITLAEQMTSGIFLAGCLVISMVAFHESSFAQTDQIAIRHVADLQAEAWNRGDGAAWGATFTDDATFTNVRGNTFTGRPQIAALPAKIFSTFYKGSHLVEKVTRVSLLAPNAAVMEVEATVTGYQSLPPGVAEPADKLLRTQMLQVLVKMGDEWKVNAFSNVTILPPMPQPAKP